MKQLHNKLSESVPFYRAWHETPYISVVHFFILAVVSTFLANAVILQINVPPEDISAVSVNSQRGGDDASVASPMTGVAGDRILVKFKQNAGQAKRSAMLAKNGLTLKSKISGINVEVLTVDPSFTPEEAVQNILRDNKADVEFAEVDYFAAPSLIPNDPNYSGQWNKSIQGLPTAWDTTTGSSSVILAVADTGVDCTHPDLVGNCVPGWNVVSNNSDTTDIKGHGTPVAGVAAATGNNAQGIAGTTWNVKIMPLRITNDPGGLAYSSDVAKAINYAADRGVKVVNNSYALAYTNTVRSAAQYLFSKGGILVASMGNAGTDTGITFNDPNYVNVSGTDGGDAKYSWSSFGTDADVAAPGCATVTASGGGYRSFCGTSSAAPEVAGLLALMFSYNPNLTPTVVRDTLFSTALDLGTPGWDPYYGWGRIRADKAIQALAGGTVPTPTFPDLNVNALTPNTATAGTPVTFTANVVNSGNASTLNSFSNLFQVATASSGSGTVSTLSTNTSAALSAGASVPVVSSSYTFTSAGTYSVRACADNNASFVGAITESNENNNCSVWTNVTVISTPPPTDTTPPSVPQNVTGNSTESNRANVSWSASTDNVAVTGYNLYRNGTKVWNGANLNYADTTVQPQTTYSYTVSAYDTAGNTSSQSTAVNITTPPVVVADTTPPSVPQNVSATAYSSTQINLSWSASTDAVGVTGYKVYRNGSQLATTAGTGYNDTSVSAGTTYTYTVSAYDAAGNTSAQSGSTSATTPAAPLAITSFSVTSKTGTSVTIKWTTNQASTGSVNFGKTSSSLATSVSDATLGTTHSVVLTGLTKNTKYFYQVNAITSSGSVKSPVSTFKTSPR